MGIEDRDWYREEIKNRAKGNEHEKSIGPRNSPIPAKDQRSNRLGIKFMLAILCFAVVVAVGRDMKDRGVPITWAGFKWWLSLWLGA